MSTTTVITNGVTQTFEFGDVVPDSNSNLNGGDVTPVVITEPTLTAPGVTEARPVAGYSRITYQIDFLNVANCVIRLEGNVAGTNFVNLSNDGNDLTITNNDTRLLTFKGAIAYVRFVLVSATSNNSDEPVITTVHLLKAK